MRWNAIVVMWIGVVIGAWIVVSSWLGITWPYPTVVLQGVGPLVLTGVWIVLIGSVIVRHRVLTVVAVVMCGVHLAVVLPLVRPNDPPRWASSAPTISVAAANVFYLNERTVEVAAELKQVDADVVVLTEVTFAWTNAMRAEGLFDLYPYQALHPYNGAGIGSAVSPNSRSCTSTRIVRRVAGFIRSTLWSAMKRFASSHCIRSRRAPRA